MLELVGNDCVGFDFDFTINTSYTSLAELMK